MKLGECDWWPRMWRTKTYQDIAVEEIRKDGTLSGCELLPHELMIEVECKGKAVFGRIARHNVNAPTDLRPVRDFLLDYVGDSMKMVEDLDVTADQFNTR